MSSPWPPSSAAAMAAMARPSSSSYNTNYCHNHHRLNLSQTKKTKRTTEPPPPLRRSNSSGPLRRRRSGTDDPYTSPSPSPANRKSVPSPPPLAPAPAPVPPVYASPDTGECLQHLLQSQSQSQSQASSDHKSPGVERRMVRSWKRPASCCAYGVGGGGGGGVGLSSLACGLEAAGLEQGDNQLRHDYNAVHGEHGDGHGHDDGAQRFSAAQQSFTATDLKFVDDDLDDDDAADDDVAADECDDRHHRITFHRHSSPDLNIFRNSISMQSPAEPDDILYYTSPNPNTSISPPSPSLPPNPSPTSNSLYPNPNPNSTSSPTSPSLNCNPNPPTPRLNYNPRPTPESPTPTPRYLNIPNANPNPNPNPNSTTPRLHYNLKPNPNSPTLCLNYNRKPSPNNNSPTLCLNYSPHSNPNSNTCLHPKPNPISRSPTRLGTNNHRDNEDEAGIRFNRYGHAHHRANVVCDEKGYYNPNQNNTRHGVRSAIGPPWARRGPSNTNTNTNTNTNGGSLSHNARDPFHHAHHDDTSDTKSYEAKVKELEISLLECATKYEVQIVELKMEMLQMKSEFRQKMMEEKDSWSRPFSNQTNMKTAQERGSNAQNNDKGGNNQLVSKEGLHDQCGSSSPKRHCTKDIGNLKRPSSQPEASLKISSFEDEENIVRCLQKKV